MPAGVAFYSLLEATGYGLAGIGYVRGLVNAGVPVRWIPLQYVGDQLHAVVSLDTHPLVQGARDDASLRDLPDLLAATSRRIRHDTVVAHTVPEHWPQLFEPGRRNVGMTVWEADLLPPHWLPLVRRASVVCVPSTMNRAAFMASGVDRPVHVVPHAMRHAFNAFTPAETSAFREQLGIPADDFVFYSINTWQPRKALDALVRTFVQAFGPDDGVTLLLKTGETGYGPAPFYAEKDVRALAQQAIDDAAAQTGRTPPPVCLMPFALSGRGVDLVHAVGDAYVTLAHGEGFGLGAFDAATLGRPVVATAWGGPLDYLGDDWPGAVRARMTPVPVLPPHKPSYWPPQRWAEPDLDAAVSTMRDTVRDPSPARAAAETIAESIANNFAEPVVTRALIAALDA